MTGALLVTVAAVGTYAAGSSPDGGPTRPVVVARRDVGEGRVVTTDDVTIADGADPFPAASSFDQIADVVGHTAVSPISSGDIVQASAVTPDRPTGRRELMLHLPIEQIALPRVRAGERVDVFATGDDGTRLVVESGEVLDVVNAEDGSLVDAREIGLVVAVDTAEVMTDLVHALRTTELTIVRSTSASGTDTDGG